MCTDQLSLLPPQWRYVTGHMCGLPGANKAIMARFQPGGISPCPPNYMQANAIPSEKFIGCADIRIS